MKNIKTINLSFVGRRSNNQDRSIAEEIKEDVIFLAVADGMGGTAGGQIAAKLVLDKALEILRAHYTSEVNPNEMKNILSEIFEHAQKVIAQRVKKEPSLNGMGTTLVCVLIDHDKYVWGSLGDSRIYRYGENYIEQITKDHTYIQDYIDKNGYSLPANVLKKFSNYLLKAIDGGTDKPDIFPISKSYEVLEKNTGFMLCSDGLITDKINGEIDLFKDIIIGNKTLEKAAQTLISLAFYNGSTDNITVVIAEYGKIKRKKIKDIPKYSYPPKDESKKKKDVKKVDNRKKIIGLLVVLVLTLFALVLEFKYGTIHKAPNYISSIFQKRNTEIKINKKKNTPILNTSNVNLKGTVTDTNKQLNKAAPIEGKIISQKSKNAQGNSKHVKLNKQIKKQKNTFSNNNVKSKSFHQAQEVKSVKKDTIKRLPKANVGKVVTKKDSDAIKDEKDTTGLKNVNAGTTNKNAVTKRSKPDTSQKPNIKKLLKNKKDIPK
jgi:serine/threonine protein phosphatase PrpC